MLGNLGASISGTADAITVDGDTFKVFATKDPGTLPWKDLGVDVVFECTGKFTDRDGAGRFPGRRRRR
ncbi:MAG: glyceraldehyde 3-phosphate dehydrogenase NAD-binding domain-containing protein [Vicinamibacterales bacterium]